MPYKGKHLDSVLRIRMKRMFIGTFGTNTRTEKWVETGHYLEGFRLMLEEIFENDGDGHVTQQGLPCGYLPDGNAVPSQNVIDDYVFYNTHFRGKKSIAFLAGDQLWLFRSKYLGNKKFIDNRLSISPKHGYDSPRQQEEIIFSGWIPGFELIKVENFNFNATSGVMTYKAVKTLDFTNAPIEAAKGGGNGDGN